MGIIISTKRPPEPVCYQFNENIKLTATGAVNIHIPFIVNHVDFFPASFKLEVYNKTVFIDPLSVDEQERADYILITHSHQDHFSPADIKNLLKDGTIIICPQQVHKKLNKVLKGASLVLTKPGDINSFGQITIESVAAYNTKSGLLTAHPRSASNVGYLISAGGNKLYHAGDTDYIPEMNRLQSLTAILTPIDGGKLTMSTEKAAELVNILRPQYVVPMHYNLGTDQLKVLQELITGETEIIIMDGQ